MEFCARALSSFLATLIFWSCLPSGLARAQDAAREEELVWDKAEAFAASRDPLADPDQLETSVTDASGEVDGEPPLSVDFLQGAEQHAVQNVQAPESNQGSLQTLPLALPSGDAKTEVTPNTVKLPQGQGSIQGMGESFKPELATGLGTYSMPIQLPPGRAGLAPTFALTYQSSGGQGLVGLGWSLGQASISRLTTRGVPRYVDQPSYHPQEDRFAYGGRELVPVDSAQAELVDCGAANCAPVPEELQGWQQYRAAIEGAFMRFFRAPDSSRWVVQDKSGLRFDFGRLPVGEGPAEAVQASEHALEQDPESDAPRIFSWSLVRTSDTHGNTIHFLHELSGGYSVVRDIYYVSPDAACRGGSPAQRRRCAQPFSSWAYRVRFVYEDRSDVQTSYVSGFERALEVRTRRIEVTANQGAVGSSRTLVRRYHFAYEPSSFHSLLASVTLEGRPSNRHPQWGAMVGDDTVPEASLGDVLIGDTLPPLRFSYGEQPRDSKAVPGFGGLGGHVVESPSSPPLSLGDPRVSLFDVNSDGLSDVLHTDPAYYGKPGQPAVGAYFNGFVGESTHPGQAAGFSAGIPIPVPSGLASAMTLTNLNLAAMDGDGDGRPEFVHMPDVGNFGMFVLGRIGNAEAPLPAAQKWAFAYLDKVLPRGVTHPRIELGSDGHHVRVVDVNGDGLIDVARTTGTELQLFLNLGWLEGGNGRFGSYTFDEVRGAFDLSSDPVRACLPHGGLPLDFEDPLVQLADMNGDGLTDMVELRRGRVRYWPGVGEAGFGRGDPCAPSEDSYVEMVNAPDDLDVDSARVSLQDVNADGAPDLLQLGYDTVSVWFNEMGFAFTERTQLTGTPRAPAFSGNVHLTDIDGSGTLDVLYGDADNYRYLDLMAGKRPRLLERVENVLGGETTLRYGTSTEDYLRDLAHAVSCTGSDCEVYTWNPTSRGCDAQVMDAADICLQRATSTPFVTRVIREQETTDHLERLELKPTKVVTRYRYHDGYYEGVEQEFRGFAVAEQESVGDAAAGSMTTRTSYHVGRRPDEVAADRLANNPNAALQGSAHAVEVFDGELDYLSSEFSQLQVRVLQQGLDGRWIAQAFAAQTDRLLYDNVRFEAGRDELELPFVAYDGVPDHGHSLEPATRKVRIRGKEHHAHVRSTVDELDALGHTLRATAFGRIRGEFGETLPDERKVNHTQMVNVPAESGWLWKPAQTFLTGEQQTRRFKETWFTYDGEGNLRKSETRVEQAVLPMFAGSADAQDYGAPAPAPLASSSTFDPWGNASMSCGGGDVEGGAPCLRLGSTFYDEDYALFPVNENIDTGTRTLSVFAEYDRGLGAATSMLDMRNQRTQSISDGLGRPTAAVLPASPACGDIQPSSVIRYELTTEPRTRPISRMVARQILDCSGSEALETTSYFDGAGRVRAVLNTGDPEAGHELIQSGVTDFDARGRPTRAYQAAFFAHDALDIKAVLTPQIELAQTTIYDAFDRPRAVIAANKDAIWTDYHALSSDVCDPLDLDAESRHVGTCTTERKDGHGRVIDKILRNRQPETVLGAPLAGLEYYRLWTTYRADDAVVKLERAQTQDDAPLPQARTKVVQGRILERRFEVDSVGRRVAATDPDSDNRTNGATWRYLFNPVGDLAAVRDPRGCGQNFFYDLAGRLIGEQYVSCSESQSEHSNAGASVPGGSVGLTLFGSPRPVSVRHYFDSYEGTWAPSPQSFEDYPSGEASSVLGRLAAQTDRGQRSVYAYDARGNVLWTARQMALISVPPAVTTSTLPKVPTPGGARTPVVFDAAHTYVTSHGYDAANRQTSNALPRDPDDSPSGAGPRIGGLMTYGRRGLPSAASALIVEGTGAPDRSTGRLRFAGATVEEHPVIAALEYDRDGAMLSTVYGDGKDGRSPTRTEMAYDAKRRLEYQSTVREPTEAPSAERLLGAVSVVDERRLVWDKADNLREVHDERVAQEWPAGQRPQTQYIEHDSLYRVTDVDFVYTQDNNVEGLDAASDYRAELTRVRAADPMRTKAAPMVTKLPAERVASLAWRYDWLGNGNLWEDDAHAFYERSLGTIRNGADYGDGVGAQPVRRPSAMYVAANLSADTPDDRGGYVELDYGVSGNVVAMTVHAQCKDKIAAGGCKLSNGTVEQQRNLLSTMCRCAHEQHYQYLWDELNRLAEARRYDRINNVANAAYSLAARQRYRYDAANQRTVKQTLPVAGSDERIALYVLPGDFERRGLTRGSDRYLADPARGAESQYLVAGARMVWQAGGVLPELERKHRLTVPITDLIGTTGAVLDLKSGELVEHATYYPNGAQETLLMHEDASVGAEPQGFTTKEADEEVGLTYFGERYLLAHLGRWASPDPMEVHAEKGGEALNDYHYVSAALLQSRDPLGLQELEPSENEKALAWFTKIAVPISELPEGTAGSNGVIIISPQPDCNCQLPKQWGAWSPAKQKEWLLERDQDKNVNLSKFNIFQFRDGDPNAFSYDYLQLWTGEGSFFGDLRKLIKGADSRKCHGHDCTDDSRHSLLWVIGLAAVLVIENRVQGKLLKHVVDGAKPGDGFTGVFDASDGRVMLRRSSQFHPLPPGYVARRGGHGPVSRELGGDPVNHSGFAAVLEQDGTLRLTWLSRTLNATDDAMVPPPLRPDIVKAVEQATGYKVSSF